MELPMTHQEEQQFMDQQEIVVTMSLKEFVHSTVAAASKKAAKEAVAEHSKACEFNIRKDEILGVGKDLTAFKLKFYSMVAVISLAGGTTGSLIGKLM
jgi:hypothetical protein